ncbi:hypothetical protein HF521_008271, partial [Silurus meridionalis]
MEWEHQSAIWSLNNGSSGELQKILTLPDPRPGEVEPAVPSLSAGLLCPLWSVPDIIRLFGNRNIVFMNVTELNLSDVCKHFSCPERSGSPADYILLYVCSAAVVLLTMFGNLLVIISVLHFKQLHTPTNMLVLSLAVTDFFVGALAMPPMLIWIIERCWIFGRGYCTMLWLIGFFLTNLSIYNVALIAVDRYFALSYPFFYMNRVS